MYLGSQATSGRRMANETAIPTVVYLPDASALRPGDIVLTRRREGGGSHIKAAWAIAQATGGAFSHALICTSPPTLIEALPGGGVSTLSLGRAFAYGRDAVRVLRYSNAEIAEEAARRAQLELGRDYSVAKAVLSVTALEAPASDRGVFCSALVAQAFVDAGAPEFARTPPHRTTPATLEYLEGFKDVTDTVFRAAPSPRNLHTLVALDGERVPSPSLRQSEISAAYAKRLSPVVAAIQRDFRSAPRSPVTTLNGCIKFLLDAYDVVDKAGADAPALNGRLQILDGLAAGFLNSGEFADLYEALREIDRDTFAVAAAESFKRDPDLDVMALRAQRDASEAELPKRIEALADFRAKAIVPARPQPGSRSRSPSTMRWRSATRSSQRSWRASAGDSQPTTLGALSSVGRLGWPGK